MKTNELKALKNELSIKAKSGLDFIIAACIIWFAISYVWTLTATTYNKSILTFIVGGPMLPLAFMLSKILKTNWKIKGNPLQPLGLWLNFAQLFYFPFLIFILLANPDFFVMTFAIITGAHFFPYAWFYGEKAYAIFAGIISLGSMLIGINVENDKMFLVPLFTAICLAVMGLIIYMFYKKKRNSYEMPN